MADPAPEQIFGIQGFQIQAAALPTHKVIRFLTPAGPIALMATRKRLLEIGQAMIATAEEMPELS